MDYRDPDGDAIAIDVAVIDAADPDSRRGAIFVNPGGPGESAIGHLTRFREVLGPQITDRFDLVAVDPRGVGISSQARCWSTATPPDYIDQAPSTDDEIKVWIDNNKYENAACATSGVPIINHVSTANVARDMDLVRRALGLDELNFVGLSYGTVVGATYRSLFPDTTRAMILDGVVDPVAWTSGGDDPTIPVSVRTGTAKAAHQSLLALLDACETAGPDRCRHATTIRREWQQTTDALRHGPVQAGLDTVSLTSLVFSAVALQYDPDDAQALIDMIHDTYRQVIEGESYVAPPPPATGDTGGWQSPTAPAAAPAASDDAPQPQSAPEHTADGRRIVPATRSQPDDAVWWDTFTQQAPMCADARNPDSYQAWVDYSNSPEALANPFTGVWLWNSSLCARWPGTDPDAYRGPFDTATATGPLVVGNTHDNATGLDQAEAVAAAIPGAVLVTVDSFGHTGIDKSACALSVATDYLVDLSLPADGTVCPADKQPF
nr:alpha/beta fold hydrolase [Corynebacterium mendelii]